MPASLPPELRWKVAVELKSLQTPIRELQKKLRSSVLLESSLFSIMPTTLLDWHKQRRQKDLMIPAPAWDRKSPTSASASHLPGNRSKAASFPTTKAALKAKAEADLREKGGSERALAWKRSREAQEARQRMVQMRRDFLGALAAHRLDIRANLVQAGKNRKARNDGVAAYHTRERNRVQREERQRMQALKAGDTEAYLHLLTSAKNERLKELVMKTDDLLDTLGQKVAMQQRQAQQEEEEGESGEGGGENEGRKGDAPKGALAGQKRYQLAVHGNAEQVTGQPACMTAGTLRSYQLAGLQWMATLYNNRLNGILADEMGLGKTIQTISLLAYLMEKKDCKGPHLIIAPKAVLPNWQKEFAKWIPADLMVVVTYDGNKDERKTLREEYLASGSFNVLLTHYDFVMKDKNHLGKVQWKYVVVDEGHRLKNDKSKLVDDMRTGYTFKHRLLLTGTPINNNLTELWALLNFILPQLFDSSDNFDEWFSNPLQVSGVDASAEEGMQLNQEEVQLIIMRLHSVLRPFLLRRKKDEVETNLPEKTDVTIHCDMSAWQKLYYKQVIMKKKMHNKSLNNMAMQLRKICIHPYLFLDDVEDRIDTEERLRSSGKLFMLARLLHKFHKSGHRVLLFSQMVRALDIVADMLEDAGYKYMRLDGLTKNHERHGQVDVWNSADSEYFIFILSTRAGGLGLNLQTADTVIILDSDWNPQQDLQAEGRAHRIGQTKPVRVITLASAGTIDEFILRRAGEKRLIDNKVIQAGMFNNQSTLQAQREMLTDIMKEGLEFSSSPEDLPSDEEINQAVARSEEELIMFNQMDADADKAMKKRGFKTRLITDREIPESIVVSIQEDNEEHEQDILGNDEDLGRGKRRANKNYCEDNNSDFEERGSSRKRLRRGKDAS